MSEIEFDETEPTKKDGRPLPHPMRHRWQPLRSGLTGIFKYDEEEFEFEGGRLLLRGNNGAGKSRVLAMQLPFLLDGDLRSQRVEPDRDPAKKMEWNVLTNRYDNRLGYTWIEFGRRDEDTGEEYFLTLGCGLHARKGMGIPPNFRWFFITDRRVGRDLCLLDDSRKAPLREQLRAQLGERGEIFQTADDYRRAIDDKLFKLGPRYGALIDLLIRLRQPQLMRELDMNWLSKILSDALPLLSENLIGNVADAFRSIDENRQEVADYRAARENVSDFLETYRHYAQLTVRRQAHHVRTTHSRYEVKGREIIQLRDEGEKLGLALNNQRAELGDVRKNLGHKRTAAQTLRDSPEMKSVSELDRARSTKEEKRVSAEKADNAQADADAFRQQMVHAAEQAREHHAAKAGEAGEAMADFQKTARDAEAPDDLIRSDEMSDRSRFDETKTQFADFRDRRESGISQIEKRNAELADADEKLRQTDAELNRENEVMQSAEDVARTAGENRTQQFNGLIEAIYEWENGLTELDFATGSDWREVIETWLNSDEAPAEFPLEIRVNEARSQSERGLISQLEKLKTERAQAGTNLTEIECKLAGLREGRQPEPLAPPMRGPDVRANREGAPLWQVCGFHEHVGETERAGFEAALESAGLLDAWIEPDGTLRDRERHDVILTAVEAHNIDDSAGLNRVLQIESDALDTAVIRRVLCQIASDMHGETWVTANGRWRNGPAHGAWKKPEAEYLGFTAREENRRRQIGVLETESADLKREIERLAGEISVIHERQKNLTDEINRAPAKDALWSAKRDLEKAEHDVARAQNGVSKAKVHAEEARSHSQKAKETRDRDAADLGLSNWRESADLKRLHGIMAELKSTANGLWPRWESLFDAAKNLAEAQQRLNDAAVRLKKCEADFQQAESEKIEAESRFETLHATIGKTVEEVLADLTSVENEISELTGRETNLDKKERETEKVLGVNQREQELAAEVHEEKRAERDATVTQLNTLVEHRIFEEADPDLQPPDGELKANPAVDLARRTEQLFINLPLDEDSLRRAEDQFQADFSTLNDQLGMQGYHPSLTTLEGSARKVTCQFQGTDRTMREMHKLLRNEVEEREQLLSAREREVIENHLLGEIASELQRCIREGENWKRDVNAELERRPTSSGIKLRFRWEPDHEGPPGLAEARDLLLKTTTAWSPGERDAIGKFLQDRIHAIQAENEGGSWQEHLTAALDYRAWHQFEVERFQDGSWKKLTKRTYGTGSGGEKAVTLTLPQFAAAAAHYQSASKTAPRLILLDEVFVGIDAPTREELMGLLESFDLDFVMTSEREWGCFKTVPALAIYQLASRPENPAVFVTRWVWNGRRLEKNENNTTAAGGSGSVG